MTRAKYREERTLVRGLRRLPGQDKATFRQNVKKLREHFEQFNVDVSEICQWLMGLRPNGKNCTNETIPYWDFFLSPEDYIKQGDKAGADRLRLDVFEVTIGWPISANLKLPQELLESIRFVIKQPKTSTTIKTLERLSRLSRPHRLVLLKAASEWIYSRYVKGSENQKRQHEVWLKEKNEWELKHPQLPDSVRQLYTNIFKDLGIKIKKPRVCSYENLKKSRRNCDWAGERLKVDGKWQNHPPLCKKFREFLKGEKNQKYFLQNAEIYLKNRSGGKSKQEALNALFKQQSQAEHWFEQSWDNYLTSLNLNENTILNDYSGALPHCTKFTEKKQSEEGKEVEVVKECEFNNHTNECTGYFAQVDSLSEDTKKLEPEYREWRRQFLAGPRKPSFQYPSSRTLPVPKIFGRDYHKIDFKNSVLSVRLDDMPEGQFLEFGFKPWPDDYDIKPGETEITSVHVNFVGTRARVGFRFKVAHKPSRFGISQDELDEMRSRQFPRASQDQQFLNEARQLLVNGFSANPEKDCNILTVDLGSDFAAAAVFKGKKFNEPHRLKILKLDKLYDARPNAGNKEEKAKTKEEKEAAKIAEETAKRKGLSKEHVGMHLVSFGEEAAEIAKKRKEKEDDKPQLKQHDLRRLTSHIRWMIRDWVRLNVSQIIELAEEKKIDLIVFESMRGFRAPGYDKIDDEKKRRLAFFAYGSIRRKVAEKAVERGMRVVPVPYKYSSQVCSECGKRQEDYGKWQKNKRDREFVCEHTGCGYKGNSDENAAKVLAGVFWGDIQLPTEEIAKTS